MWGWPGEPGGARDSEPEGLGGAPAPQSGGELTEIGPGAGRPQAAEAGLSSWSLQERIIPSHRYQWQPPACGARAESGGLDRVCSVTVLSVAVHRASDTLAD
jgi:hypothetical protein